MLQTNDFQWILKPSKSFWDTQDPKKKNKNRILTSELSLPKFLKKPFQPPFQVRLPVCSWIPELPHTAGVIGIRNARNRKNPTLRESKTSSSYANAVGGDTVDQSRLVVYPIFRVLLHPRWCRISAINSSIVCYGWQNHEGIQDIVVCFWFYTPRILPNDGVFSVEKSRQSANLLVVFSLVV